MQPPDLLPAPSRTSRLAIVGMLGVPFGIAVGLLVWIGTSPDSHQGWDGLGAFLLAFFAGVAVALVGLIVSIVAWVRIARRDDLEGRSYAITGVALPGMLILAFALIMLLSQY